MRKQRTLLAILGLLTIWLVFFYSRIGLIPATLQGNGDVAGWEYTGFYFLENLKFTPFPVLDFANNHHFYPEGLSPVFQSWALERDYFYGLLSKVFGPGPWLFYYYGLSILVTSIGSFLLLRRSFHDNRAAMASIFLTYVNAYAMQRFPAHFGIAVHHWSSLSVIAHFLVFYRFSRNRQIPLKLHLISGLLTLLSLGQELGYVAGIALTSFVVTYGLMALIGLWRYRKGLRNFCSSVLGQWWQDFKSQSSTQVLVLVILAAAFFIVSPLLSIVTEIGKQQTGEMLSGNWWAHPLRFLVPLEPSLGGLYGEQFKDSTETFIDGIPGWFLLFIGLGGVYYSIKKRRWAALSLLTLLGLFVFYAPEESPILKVFPWFRYARVGPRPTIIYPTILVCLSLLAPLGFNMSRRAIGATLLAVVLFGIDTFNIYSRILPPVVIEPPGEFLGCMEEIKKQPGEAVLDFPFCYKGGNGGGICNFEQTTGTWALRKYHEKKVLGSYFARLSAKNARFYEAYGLDRMLHEQRKTCLSRESLVHLKQVYEIFDFCCLHLLSGILGADCTEGFEDVFGPAERTCNVPGTGVTSLFIKKDHNLPKLSSQDYHLFDVDLLRLFNSGQLKVKAGMVLLTKPDYLPVVSAIGRSHDLKVSLTTDEAHPTGIYILKTRDESTLGDHLFRIFKGKVYEVFLYQDKPDQIITDLIAPKMEGQFKEDLEHSYDRKPGSLFIHPKAGAIAQYQVASVDVPEKAFLKVQYALDHPRGDVTFVVKVDGVELMRRKVDSSEGTPAQYIDLKEFIGPERSLTFEVDPNGSPNNDWAYWVEAKIIARYSDPPEVLNSF